MNLKFIYFIIILLSVSALGQNSDRNYLDSLFVKARETINTNTQESIKLSNHLLRESKSSKNQEMEVKAYYLLAFNAYLGGNAEEVNTYLDKGIEIARKINYHEGEALCLRLLGTQYAKLKLLDQSQKTLESSLKILEGLTTEEANEIRGMVYNSLLILIDDADATKTTQKIQIAKNAIHEFTKLEDKKRQDDLLISAYTNLGYLYSRNDNHDSANLVLQAALKRNKVKKDTYLFAAIYHDMGFAFQNMRQNDSAIFYYHKALNYSLGSDFHLKRLEIYERLYKVYKEENDLKSSNQFLEKYTILNDSINRKNAAGVGQILAENQKKTEKVYGENQLFKILMIFLGAAVFLCLIFLIWQWRDKKKQRNKFLKYIAELKSNQSKEISPIDNFSENKFSILEETEVRILENLESFEKELAFNDSEVSLVSLANQINTNTKYLSEIIKKHKGVNFNGYINELRIRYIVNKLQEDPKYRHYKISHLAEETGFSSHSAFSTIFSQVMGITPSNFIKFLNEK